ncbi:hypothetical protein TNCV_2998451 [Trichonephila clavipes]|nr:hypothetical protein TNCV_2998451 [Trichonephila clavipes]
MFRCNLPLPRAEQIFKLCGVTGDRENFQSTKCPVPTDSKFALQRLDFALHYTDYSDETATADSDVAQSGRPIFDDFFQHLWPYIGNNTAHVVFQMVKRLWLIRIDQ